MQRRSRLFLIGHFVYSWTAKDGNALSAVKVSPHPGQVKAEINSLPRGEADSEAGKALERNIHSMLFADEVESQEAVHV